MIAPRPKTPTDAAAQRFIEAAPDAAPAAPLAEPAKRVQISLTLRADLLAKIDEAAAAKGLSRAAYIVSAAVEKVSVSQ